MVSYFMRKILLISLLTWLPVMGVQAANIDVYTGEAVVGSKEAGDRRRALPLALNNVLQKFSGLRSFEDYPQVEPALANASSILVSFYYRNIETVFADGSEGEELRMVVKFSENSVDELARTLQLPLWQTEREPTDIWVVVDDGQDRRIMPVEFAYTWEAMADVAATRGFPVNWPVADEEGRYLIDAQLLWGGYTEDLGIGHGSSAMIVAARREGLEWSVRNNLTYGSQNWTWRIQDINLQAALTQSMQEAVDLAAAANTIAASDLGTWVHELTVAGLGGADDYERCLGYLQQLSVVNQVSVVSAHQESVTFRFELNALPQYLEETLLGGRFLEFDEDELNYFLPQ
jgi:hypothetical protein